MVFLRIEDAIERRGKLATISVFRLQQKQQRLQLRFTFCAQPANATTRRNILRFLGRISPFYSPLSRRPHTNIAIELPQRMHKLLFPRLACHLLPNVAATFLAGRAHSLQRFAYDPRGSWVCGVCDCSDKIIKSWNNSYYK